MRFQPIILIFFLIGCASSSPSQSDLNNLNNYGPAPSDAEQILRAHLKYQLKDPSSLQIQDPIGPKRMYDSRRFGSGEYGWGYCVMINGKNSYGAYVGFRTMFILVKNDHVIRSSGGVTEADGLSQEIANTKCRFLAKIY